MGFNIAAAVSAEQQFGAVMTIWSVSQTAAIANHHDAMRPIETSAVCDPEQNAGAWSRITGRMGRWEPHRLRNRLPTQNGPAFRRIAEWSFSSTPRVESNDVSSIDGSRLMTTRRILLTNNPSEPLSADSRSSRFPHLGVDVDPSAWIRDWRKRSRRRVIR